MGCVYVLDSFFSCEHVETVCLVVSFIFPDSKLWYGTLFIDMKFGTVFFLIALTGEFIINAPVFYLRDLVDVEMAKYYFIITNFCRIFS